MKCIFYLTLLTIVCWHYSFGQDQYLNFDFTCKSKQAQNSIISIDRRTNPQLLGYMPIKGYSGLANVRFKGALADSIGIFFASPSVNQDKKRVLILENFFLNCGSNPAKLILSLRLYSQISNDAYAPVCSIDSIYQLSGDPFGRISELFCEISNLADKEITKATPDTAFVSRDGLNHLDSLEKLNIPMYVSTKPVPGVYKDYAHFKMNQPDISTDIFITVTKRGVVEVDRTYKGKKRRVKLNPSGIYAVSDGDRILKVTPSGEYFEIVKRGFDFYYDRPGYFYDQPNTYSPYYFPGGGRIGTTGSGDLAIRIGGPKQIDIVPTYRFKINYKKGSSIPIGLVK
ncbi:hypothetical protein J2Y45_004709 [Dyadobacter sp. BE34]|uniref:Uncharacterized protein n=1 Tax=Dyadobacter fermentans TaxID=94254 RepID=A0ABU1R283_9BACT|nr:MULTISPECIES: hypothetical protein [Dyadobacter]MDR6807509.1 hypothetical protein [Dyadobacter fermentans]MDR7045250.1 hypothetical protein [Dyadobacter sp. BE242]MDR7199563.1 hypothetical protein [Dyadobacter sp. BE34]MDR7217978.1 hypothetical protein [Dyadobacter sp. BE31]MDR7265454.1 hypothetical protein [Dyadobacter sp. BE32]